LIAVNHSGINRLDLRSKTFEYYLYKGLTRDGLNNENLKCVYKDREGIIWIGTGAAGVNVYNSQKSRFAVYRHSELADNSVINNAIFRFFEDSQGLIWIGTDGGGLSVFDAKTKNFKNYQHKPSDPYSIGSNSVLGITEDENHDIWIGCWAGGLNRLNRKSGRFYQYHPNAKDQASISSNDVWDVMFDDKGHLWLSYYEVGVDVFDVKKGVVQKYRHNSLDSTSLISNNIMGIIHRADNKLGFISENGYCVFDPLENKFHQNRKLGGLALFDVYEDKNGNHWIATKGNGLWIIWADGKIEKYNKSYGFPSNTICGILEDNQGNMWISTYSGLSEYLTKEKKFRHYNKADGLQGSQFSSFARLKSKDGTLYFGGYSGFVAFNPDSIKTNPYIPHVYINEFQIFNTSVTTKTANTPLKYSIAETNEIVLSYKESVFSFGFSAINFTYPEKSIYAYQMKGYDKGWNYTDFSRRYATYTNLDPGVYTFMVKAANNDGVWNENPAIIHITITPPWWKTWWLRTAVMLLLSGFVIFIYRIRVASLHRSKRQLELKVAERTKELEHTNIELKEHSTQLQIANIDLEDKQKQILIQNEKIGRQKENLEKRNEENIQITKQLNEANQVKNRFITNISHEFRTPLTLILGPLDSIISESRGNKPLLEKLNIIKGNAKRLLKLVNQLLELRNVDSESISLQLEEHDLALLIQNIFNSFKLKAEQKQIRYTLVLPYDQIIGIMDSDKFEMIIFNLLSNAFKFTPEGGEITVSVNIVALDTIIQSKTGKLTVEVADNGSGILKEDLDHIFDRFFQSDSTLTRKHGGSGIGLALAKELAEKLSGNITVVSDPDSNREGKGSCFRVTIPIEFSKGIPQEKNEALIMDLQIPIMKPKLAFSTVLVVEDNKDLRKYLNSELKYKYTIIEAENGQMAIEKAKEFLPDIVVSDVMMPVMDGFRFCELLKTDWQTSHIPIILLTAKTDTASLYQGLEIGADAYMPKPFEIQHLIAQISNLISNRKKLFEKYSASQTQAISMLSNDSVDKELINKALKIIEENLSNSSFGVDLLADKMNMSRSLLYKKVMAVTNISIGEIIRNIRLEKAAELLKENRFSILEIALKVGFTDRPQFTRSFTNKYGEGPKQYQQKN